MGVSFSQQITQLYEYAGFTPGDPLPEATMTFYIAGTSTMVDVYTDKDETTPAPNPLISDSDGVFPQVFLSDVGLYRVVSQRASGSVLFDINNIGPDNDLQTQVDANTAEISSLDSRITANEVDIGAANVQINDNTMDIATLQTDQGNVENDIAVLQTDVTNLQNDVAAINVEVDALFTDVSYISFTVDGTTPNVVKSTDGLGISSVVFTAPNRYTVNFNAQAQITALSVQANSTTQMRTASFSDLLLGATVTSIDIYTFNSVVETASPFSCKMNYQSP